ncbi:uncharacterized protein LOC122512008 [Leptopilina heterotoma]|uniref:uncharacterized protein LOC122512008 n=1 Tax=Leptopilina heterotoma TaxID=63436 RepID=UPI001CA8E024|nr:uncharacterized protein LOC122512008 [Leptopilina heterotoma]
MKSKKETNGTYIYLGITNILKNSIFPENIAFPGNVIKLLINIDGLPLYNKSSIQVWPILVQILHPDYYCKPFLAGIFCGDSKPEDVEEFLYDFVEEIKEEIPNGVEVNNKKYDVEISALVCDMPVRSYIKCTKSHTGFYSCERCETRGKTVNKKRVFPKMNRKKRTKHSFTNPRTKNQRLHHIPNRISPLLKILNFDPVSQVLLDYMHLLCNGCMKTLLERWLGQKRKKGKLKTKDRKKLTKLLSKLKGSIPNEFQRKTFDGSDLTKWKATQFRFFLLYVGTIILRFVHSKEYYSNFLNLSVASRMPPNFVSHSCA